jgi:hypothetical protein
MLPPAGSAPSGEVLLALLREILERVAHVERQQEAHNTAYPVNDLRKPDFDGHRRDHVHRMKVAELLDSYKHGATKSIIAWVTIFVLGLMASGGLSFIKDHLK